MRSYRKGARAGGARCARRTTGITRHGVLAEEREPQAFNVPGQCSIRRVTVRPPADSHSLAATKGVVFLVWP